MSESESEERAGDDVVKCSYCRLSVNVDSLAMSIDGTRRLSTCEGCILKKRVSDNEYSVSSKAKSAAKRKRQKGSYRAQQLQWKKDKRRRIKDEQVPQTPPGSPPRSPERPAVPAALAALFGEALPVD